MVYHLPSYIISAFSARFPPSPIHGTRHCSGFGSSAGIQGGSPGKPGGCRLVLLSDLPEGSHSHEQPAARAARQQVRHQQDLSFHPAPHSLLTQPSHGRKWEQELCIMNLPLWLELMSHFDVKAELSALPCRVSACVWPGQICFHLQCGKGAAIVKEHLCGHLKSLFQP